MHTLRCLVGLALLGAGCGARTEPGATPGAGDAATLDAGGVRCTAAWREPCAGAWSFGEPVTLGGGASSLQNVESLALQSMEGDCEGAWLTVNALSRSGQQPVQQVVRLDTRGREGPIHTLVPRPSASTLAVNFASRRAALLFASDAGHRSLRLDDPSFPNNSPAALELAPGSPLSGASSGAATPTGFSFLAEQVRALWGLERVAVDNTGALRERRVLDVPVDVGLRGDGNFERVAYSDGGYTMLWIDRARGMREALAYDAAEQAGTAQTLRSTGRDQELLGARATDDGFVDAWRAARLAPVTLSFRDRAGARSLRDVVRPDAPGEGALALAYARGAVLTVSATGSGVPLLLGWSYRFATDAANASDPLRLDARATAVRVVASGDGALAVWLEGSGTLRAAPLLCR